MPNWALLALGFSPQGLKVYGELLALVSSTTPADIAAHCVPSDGAVPDAPGTGMGMPLSWAKVPSCLRRWVRGQTTGYAVGQTTSVLLP